MGVLRFYKITCLCLDRFETKNGRCFIISTQVFTGQIVQVYLKREKKKKKKHCGCFQIHHLFSDHHLVSASSFFPFNRLLEIGSLP